ncbi:MAG: transaldolase [Pirellulales bacterium]|nr:transaldolase [Pirellulales bacterium]
MSGSIQSLIATGTKLWLDSVDPQLVAENRAQGATGATSNPVIISDLIKTGRFDNELETLMKAGHDDSEVAWLLTDQIVSAAEQVFHPVWQETAGDDGYVSFELDPLLEDAETGPEHAARVAKYIELGKQWAADHDNRMIKVPATPAGIDALEALVAHGVTVNVTLIFTPRQYQAARDAVWRGAQQRDSLAAFKSVYSIFISRVDVYTLKHVPELSANAQGQMGIVNAKRLWADNQSFWADKQAPLSQEIIFASTGAKLEGDSPIKYVEALAGSDIQTNPPSTNEAVEASGKVFERTVDVMPSDEVLGELDEKVDIERLEEVLMAEGIDKFASPQKALLALIAEKRALLTAGVSG